MNGTNGRMEELRQLPLWEREEYPGPVTGDMDDISRKANLRRKVQMLTLVYNPFGLYEELPEQLREVTERWMKASFKAAGDVLYGPSAYSLRRILEKDTGLLLSPEQFTRAMELTGFVTDCSEGSLLFKISMRSAVFDAWGRDARRLAALGPCDCLQLRKLRTVAEQRAAESFGRRWKDLHPGLRA